MRPEEREAARLVEDGEARLAPHTYAAVSG
jgi:hypothetical protein